MKHAWGGYTTYVLVLACICGALLSYLRVVPHDTPHEIAFSTDGDIDFTAESAYWRERISAVGAADAYEEFASTVAALNNRAQHVAAHTFGDALYVRVGLSAFHICDERFGQGCMHALIGEALGDMGLDALSVVRGYCDSLEGTFDRIGCEHGLGHGLVNFFGYEQRNLAEAVEACGDVDSEIPAQVGCTGGAHMEFNFRTMLLAHDGTMRTFTGDAKFEPCRSLSASDRPTCMFWQPAWWRNATEYDSLTDAFRTFGAYCRESAVLGEDSMIACFQGLGYDAPLVRAGDAVAALELCRAATITPLERAACWSWLTWYFSEGELESLKSGVCEDFTGADMMECEARRDRESFPQRTLTSSNGPRLSP